MRAIAVLCILAGVARADDASDAVKPLLEQQAKAIAAGDATAFAATFTDDAMAILPTAADEGIGRPAIETAAKHWLASAKGAVKVDKLVAPKSQSIGVGAWFDAELVGAVHWRVTGIVIHARKSDGSEGPFKIAAYHLSEPAEDQAVLAAAAAGKLPALPKLESDKYPGDTNDPASISDFAKHVEPHPAATLIGSAAKEHATGSTAVAKLLAGWRSLKLAGVAYRSGRDESAEWGFEWTIGHVEATFTVKGKPVKVPYRALVILDVPSAVGADHGAPVQLISAHYSVATR